MKQTSKYQAELYNSNPITNAYYPEVTIQSAVHGSYTLEGRLLSREPTQPASIMVIHGARADFTKADALLLPLLKKGLSILSATTSGHGVTGHQSDMPFSLDDNLAEAEAFSRLLTTQHRTVMGFSMGGTTAVRLLQQNPGAYDRLLLFYPAVFADAAYCVPFGTDEFRTIASKKDYFLSSSFFEVILSFPGKIMLIKGQYDGLDPAQFGKDTENTVSTVSIEGRGEVYSPIPPQVFSRIRELRPDTEYIEMPGADHQFAKWFAVHPDDAMMLSQKLFDFITS